MPHVDLQPDDRFSRAERGDERLKPKHLAAALLLHAVVLFGLFLLPRGAPPAEEALTVELVEESGSAGAAGGSAGGGGGGDTRHEEQQQEKAAETTERPPDVAPPRKKPRPPVPKAAPRVEEKPVEPVPARPEPEPPQTAALAPPPGPTIGPGEGPVLPSPGARSGSADQGPGGASGAGLGRKGTGAGAFGQGEGPGDDYLDRLRRWLAKYKRYPPDAIKRKQQGTVVVEFVLARDGTVLDAHIERSSGFPLLDRAVIELLDRASPVPPLPDRYEGERAKLALPIDFKLGFFARHF